ncbi:MAG: hypothetical protein AAGG75_27445 [Bacteroidota bacterium]
MISKSKIQHLIFIIFILCGLFSCSEDESLDISGNPINNQSDIPEQLTYYDIDIDGDIWGDFSRSACLFVRPTVTTPSGINFNNGVNEREVGLISGFPGGSPAKGAIWYFTNTALCRDGSTGCNSTPVNAALDLARVTVNESAGTIIVRLDGTIFNNSGAGSTLTSSFLNHFTANSGLLATLYQLIEGEIRLNFSEEGDRVSGTIDMRGVNFSGTGTAPYTASFSGRKANISAAACR